MMIMMIKVYSQPLCINALCHSFIRTHPTLKTLELLPIPLVLCSSLEKITLSQKALSLLTSLQCPLCQKCLTGDRFITMSALINPHFTGSRVARRKGTFLLVSQTSSSYKPSCINRWFTNLQICPRSKCLPFQCQCPWNRKQCALPLNTGMTGRHGFL